MTIQAAFFRKFPHADSVEGTSRRVEVRQRGRRVAVWTSVDGVTWVSDAPPEIFVVA